MHLKNDGLPPDDEICRATRQQNAAIDDEQYKSARLQNEILGVFGFILYKEAGMENGDPYNRRVETIYEE